jgi:hypothetical protein
VNFGLSQIVIRDLKKNSYVSGGDEEEASNQHLHDEKLNKK